LHQKVEKPVQASKPVYWVQIDSIVIAQLPLMGFAEASFLWLGAQRALFFYETFASGGYNGGNTTVDATAKELADVVG